jgi:hypothetical protein
MKPGERAVEGVVLRSELYFWLRYVPIPSNTVCGFADVTHSSA